MPSLTQKVGARAGEENRVARAPQPSSRRAAPLAQVPQARLEEGFLFPPQLLEATPSSFPGTFASYVSEQTQRSSGHGHHSL